MIQISRLVLRNVSWRSCTKLKHAIVKLRQQPPLLQPLLLQPQLLLLIKLLPPPPHQLIQTLDLQLQLLIGTCLNKRRKKLNNILPLGQRTTLCWLPTRSLLQRPYLQDHNPNHLWYNQRTISSLLIIDLHRWERKQLQHKHLMVEVLRSQLRL